VRDLVVRSRKTLETCRPDRRLEGSYFTLHMCLCHRCSRALIRVARPVVCLPPNHSTDAKSILYCCLTMLIRRVLKLTPCRKSKIALLSPAHLSCFYPPTISHNTYLPFSVADHCDLSRLGLPMMTKERLLSSESRTSRPTRLIVDCQICATDTKGFDTSQFAPKTRLTLICGFGYR
jgi:hypothetical protein